jgi:hypothetical protein
MGILIYGGSYIVNNSADGVMPSEENNYLVAMRKLPENYNNTVAMKTVLHSLSTFESPFSTIPKDFDQYHDTLIEISKKINEDKFKNSPLYSNIIDILWPKLTQKVYILFLFSLNVFFVQVIIFFLTN